MSKTMMKRLEKLEQSAGERETGRTLIASDRAEAAKLQEQHPSALVIVTGVSRSSHGVAR